MSYKGIGVAAIIFKIILAEVSRRNDHRPKGAEFAAQTTSGAQGRIKQQAPALRVFPALQCAGGTHADARKAIRTRRSGLHRKRIIMQYVRDPLAADMVPHDGSKDGTLYGKSFRRIRHGYFSVVVVEKSGNLRKAHCLERLEKPPPIQRDILKSQIILFFDQLDLFTDIEGCLRSHPPQTLLQRLNDKSVPASGAGGQVERQRLIELSR
jgi:hypothetical protein